MIDSSNYTFVLPLVSATPPGSHEASRGVEDVLSAVTKILPSRFQILAVIFNLVNVYLENRMRFEWRSKLWGWLRDGWCWFCVNWVRSKQLIFPLLFSPEVAFNLVLIMEQNAKYPRKYAYLSVVINAWSIQESRWQHWITWNYMIN